MTAVYIAGIAMTVFGRHPDRSVKDLAAQAIRGALLDAGCEHEALDAAFYCGMTNGVFQGQHAIPGQVVLADADIRSVPVFNVENACASGSTGVHLAVQYLRSGAADIVLVAGAEKMNGPDKNATLAIFEAGWDVEDADRSHAELQQMGKGIRVPPGTRSDRPYSRFMDVYAAMARWHMTTYGTTQRQFAAVSAKNHRHSTMNPYAQYQKQYTVEQVLAAPPITYPLTLPMCAPVSDGAAALILCTHEGLARIGGARSRAVRVLASSMRTASSRGIDEPDLHVSALAAQAAYEAAGAGPADMDVAEVHDATAVGEIIQVENLGLSDRGAAGRRAEEGHFSLGGRIPVNPSGGLESKGHPLGATGIGQLFELVTQLRAEAGPRQVEGARLAIQENGGGFQQVEEAVVAVHILGK